MIKLPFMMPPGRKSLDNDKDNANVDFEADIGMFEIRKINKS